MDQNQVKITDIITTEYLDFLDFCEASGKQFVCELTNVDFVAFRTDMRKPREYVNVIKKLIENYIASEKVVKDDVYNGGLVTNNVQCCGSDDEILFMEQSSNIVKENVEFDELFVRSENIVDSVADKLDTNEESLIINHCEKSSIAELLKVNGNDFSGIGIDTLNLSTRAENCLTRGKCRTVADVLCLTAEQLLSFRNIGKKSFDEILSVLKDLVEKNDMRISMDDNKCKSVFPISDELKIAIEAMLAGEEYAIDLLNEEQLKVLEKMREAVDVIGSDMCLLAYRNPHYNVKLCVALYKFSFPYINNKKIIDDIVKHIGTLEPTLISKKLIPFISAYSAETGKNLNWLLLHCSTDTTISRIPSVFESLQNEKDVIQKKISDIHNFLDWLEFDLSELSDMLLQKIKEHFQNKNSRTYEVYEMRNSGMTLEDIGDCIGVTRERVRQIEAKFYRIFWAIYSKMDYDPLLLIYALKNGVSVLYFNDIQEFLGKTSSMLWTCLINLPNHKYYYYSNSLNALIINFDNKQKIDESALLDKIDNIIDSFPDILFSENVSGVLDKTAYENDVPIEVLSSSFYNTYRLSGSFYYCRNALTVVFMCGYVLKNRFQNGFKINDEFECNRFYQYMIEFFGDKAKSTTYRAIDAKVCEIGCLCDRGKYIHPDYLQVSSDVIDTMNDFIASSSRSVLTYGEVFEELKYIFEGTQITNKYLMQGALKKYGCKFKMDRSYIKKDCSISFVNELEDFVEERGLVHKSEIFAKFASITDVGLSQVIARCENVFNIDEGYYIHSSMFDIQTDDYESLRQYLSKACEDMLVHINTVYEFIGIHCHDFMRRNDFENKERLFAALNYMFREEFNFSRPYIAGIGEKSVSNKSVILRLIDEYDSIEVDELFDICTENNINAQSTQSISYLSKLLSPQYVRVNRTTLMKYECTGLNDDVIQKVVAIIEEMLERTGYVVCKKIKDFIWFPQIAVEWNEFLLENIITQDNKINVVFIVSKTLKHSNAIFVSPKYKDETFESLVVKILTEEVKKGSFTSKTDMRDWLTKKGFINGKFPNFLESEKYFYTDETGIYCSGER